ncbi:MAG: PAS domain S-box protein [Deltaproteobacteria bacterium]|nr:PAS domain S-box protein [Deltaproteobacteria bacterium]
MGKKPTYADLEKRLEKLEEETSTRKSLEEQFRTLSISAPFGMSIMKPDMNFEYFNPKFTEIFGYTIEDLPDKQPPGKKIQMMNQKRQKKNRGSFQ